MAAKLPFRRVHGKSLILKTWDSLSLQDSGSFWAHTSTLHPSQKPPLLNYYELSRNRRPGHHSIIFVSRQQTREYIDIKLVTATSISEDQDGI